VSGQLHYPRGKSPRYSFYRRLGGLQSRSARGGEEKKYPCPCREYIPGLPAHSSVTTLTELPPFLKQPCNKTKILVIGTQCFKYHKWNALTPLPSVRRQVKRTWNLLISVHAHYCDKTKALWHLIWRSVRPSKIASWMYMRLFEMCCGRSFLFSSSSSRFTYLNPLGFRIFKYIYPSL